MQKLKIIIPGEGGGYFGVKRIGLTVGNPRKLLFETSLYYFSFLDCFIRAKPFAFQLLRDEVSKQSKKSGVPPIILFLLKWLSPDFLQIKTFDVKLWLFTV